MNIDKHKQLLWDQYFMDIAQVVANKSKDPSTKTGAVIVRPDKTIASTGFNGFPRNMLDLPELYNNRLHKYNRIIHCEMNAVLTAHEPVSGYTLYTWPFASCSRCAVHMIQAGIQRFVFPPIPEHLKERWGQSLSDSTRYFDEACVEWSEVK